MSSFGGEDRDQRGIRGSWQGAKPTASGDRRGQAYAISAAPPPTNGHGARSCLAGGSANRQRHSGQIDRVLR